MLFTPRTPLRAQRALAGLHARSLTGFDCDVSKRLVIIESRPNASERLERPQAARPALEGECMATCPECDAEIEIDDDDLAEMELGDPWDCDACSTRLRVASL